MHFLIFPIVIGVALLLARVWTGVMNQPMIERESLASIEFTHPYMPRHSAVIVAALATIGLLVLAAKRLVPEELLTANSAAIKRTIFVFLAVVGFGVFDIWRWHGLKDRYQYFYAFVISTVVSWILIGFKRAFFETGLGQDPYLMALGIVCVILGWRFLFGSWSASIKATVLGTFIFWISYAILRHETPHEILATMIAVIAALVPVVVWCLFFLSCHIQRISVVLLAFFAGMLSTLPILFYDALTRRAIEFNFFLFRIVPENFGGTSQEFVKTSVFQSLKGTSSAVMITLVTYLLVGAIEEVSKYWVLRQSGRQFFRSVDDVLQLGVIVAIGFAFAENLANPNYFVGFVQNYLLAPGGPDWASFIGNVVGRAVLTNMVHILSTGILAYFFGLAFFATPMLKAQFEQGRVHPALMMMQEALSIRCQDIYRTYRIAQGLIFAVLLHGLFDFILSLPDVLPGHPTTIGAVLGLRSPIILHSLSITFLPSVLYVVGGTWILLYLFARKEDMKEFGALVASETFVRSENA